MRATIVGVEQDVTVPRNVMVAEVLTGVVRTELMTLLHNLKLPQLQLQLMLHQLKPRLTPLPVMKNPLKKIPMKTS